MCVCFELLNSSWLIYCKHGPCPRLQYTVYCIRYTVLQYIPYGVQVPFNDAVGAETSHKTNILFSKQTKENIQHFCKFNWRHFQKPLWCFRKASETFQDPPIACNCVSTILCWRQCFARVSACQVTRVSRQAPLFQVPCLVVEPWKHRDGFALYVYIYPYNFFKMQFLWPFFAFVLSDKDAKTCLM